ncbi:MAG: TetR family transcriptional regulator [Acidimicrobiales bacterium]|nr:TetR family transcriptional regulator [Acidimicrobiales bacterium]
MTADIKAIARRHLAERGADGLSLRAVARELGVVSSAVYRYVASRDQLLTLLIVDAFEAVGEAAEQAAADREGGFEARWGRVCHAVRDWARAHPQDYALVYGTPIPGYEAPVDTVSPALRVTLAAMRVVADGVADGEVGTSPQDKVPRAVHADFSTLRRLLDLALPDEVVGRSLAAWNWLLGHVSYELFGHLHGGITDHDSYFDHQLRRVTRELAGRT